MSDSQTHGERVRASILLTGLALWRDDPAKVNASQIGKRLGMTHAACIYHFGSAAAMRDAIACEAVRIGDSVIVPMLITGGHAAAATLGESERRRYLAGC